MEDITLKELKAGLDMAAKSGKTLDYKGKFTVAPQLPEGRSFWAQQLREGRLAKQTDVVWAFTQESAGASKTWLAVRVNFQGQAHYFNLQNEDDRAKLRKLEKAIEAINGVLDGSS